MPKGKVSNFKLSALSIAAGVGSGISITSISQGDPAVVTTSAAHGLVSGNVVQIAGAGTNIDGSYAIRMLTTTTFELLDLDTTGVTVTLNAATAAPVTWLKTCEFTSINKAGGTIDQIDVSTACSTRREYVSGLADSGTVAFGFNYYPVDEVQEELARLEESGERFWMRLEHPNADSTGVIGTSLYYGSIQTGMNMDGAVAGIYTSGVTVQLSGPTYFMRAVA